MHGRRLAPFDRVKAQMKLREAMILVSAVFESSAASACSLAMLTGTGRNGPREGGL